MKNQENWKETVYKKTKSGYVGNYKYVYKASTLIANILAVKHYQNVNKYIKGDLIDVGCGYVPLYEMYKDKISSHTCVDWADSFHKNVFLDYICDLNESPLPFKDDSYDSVILTDVLEHIRKPEQLINELYRIQRKDGILLLSVPFLYPIHEQPFDYYRYSQYALRSMLEDAGYNIKKLDAVGGAFESTVNLIAKLSMKLPILGKYFAIPFQEIAWWMISRRVKKGKDIGFTRFPLSYIVIAQK